MNPFFFTFVHILPLFPLDCQAIPPLDREFQHRSMEQKHLSGAEPADPQQDFPCFEKGRGEIQLVRSFLDQAFSLGFESESLDRKEDDWLRKPSAIHYPTDTPRIPPVTGVTVIARAPPRVTRNGARPSGAAPPSWGSWSRRWHHPTRAPQRATILLAHCGAVFYCCRYLIVIMGQGLLPYTCNQPSRAKPSWPAREEELLSKTKSNTATNL